MRNSYFVDGKKLKALRLSKKMTAAELSTKACITKSYLSKIECSAIGRVSPRVAMAIVIALDAEPEELLSSNEQYEFVEHDLDTVQPTTNVQRIKLTAKSAEIAILVEELGFDDRQIILDIVKTFHKVKQLR